MASWIVIVLIVLDLIIAVAYAIEKDFARVVYWIAAAVLTYTTLIME